MLLYGLTRRRRRLPSNLRPTTRECVHLATRCHFRSRDKDGGHTIRSAMAETHMLHMLHANCTTLCVTEPKLLPIEVWDFKPFCSGYLDLDQMTFIYELDPYLMGIY